MCDAAGRLSAADVSHTIETYPPPTASPSPTAPATRPAELSDAGAILDMSVPFLPCPPSERPGGTRRILIETDRCTRRRGTTGRWA